MPHQDYVAVDSFLAQQALYQGEVRFIRDVNGKIIDLEAEGRSRKAHRDCVESMDRVRGSRPMLADPDA